MESMELIKSHKIYKSSLFALPKNISAVWIKPDMVCEVKHEVDVVGNLHIKFIKLRPDKNAWDCTGEFLTCILTCINSKKIEIIRIKSVFDKNKNHVEKVVDLITTWFFSIYIIVVSFYCARVGCDSKSL